MRKLYSVLLNLLLLLMFLNNAWHVTRTNVANAFLLFPAASVLQITSSVAAPVILPGRKLFMDWGFQFNWDLPWNPASFYDLSTFANTLTGRRDARAALLTYNQTNALWSNVQQKYAAHIVSNDSAIPLSMRRRRPWHASDFTAAELYESLENLLMRYGFDESCLLRSVCELARHPFADDQQNMLTELLTFLLTPSLLAAFAPSETLYRAVYEEAERRGFLGDDCARLYAHCTQDLLGGVTRIVYGA